MSEVFDLGSFYVDVAASAKERGPLRQDLVRGLKDWYFHIYKYDRYGAETVLLLPDRMGVPHIFGFAVLRILRDRRVSDGTKTRIVRRALDLAEQESDLGPPFGLLSALLHLAKLDELSPTDLRYALIVTEGRDHPFEGGDKSDAVELLHHLLERDDLPAEERAFWSHSLICRHHDAPGVSDLITSLLGSERVPKEMRREICWAWVHRRQPRLEVLVPNGEGDHRSQLVAERMPFWIAHMRSWSSLQMVRQGLVWLARLGEDPLTLAQVFISDVEESADQIHGAVADIIAEHHAAMPDAAVARLVERGTSIRSSAPTRRRFYRLGADLFGPEYLRRAMSDSAGSVRHWAARQLAKEMRSAGAEETLTLAPGIGEERGDPVEENA